MVNLSHANNLAAKINAKLMEHWKVEDSIKFSVAVGVTKCDGLSLIR